MKKELSKYGEIWFCREPWKMIHKDVLIFVHFYKKRIERNLFKEAFMQMFNNFNEKVFDHIYSFKRIKKSYSLFAHQIRNSRQLLKKKGMLLIENDYVKATEKLTKYYKNEINKKKKLIKDFLFSIDSFLNEEDTLNNKILITSKIRNEIRKLVIDKPDLETIKERIRNSKAISKLRYSFKKQLEWERNKFIKNQLIAIKKYQTYLEKDFLYPDGAHIIPVYFLVYHDRIKDITNKYNGIFLDPNTHRLFDKQEITFNENYDFVWSSSNKPYLSILDCVKTPERKKFISEYLKLKRNKKL